MQPGKFTFFTAANREWMRLEPDGRAFVNGELVATNVEVYERFAEWVAGELRCQRCLDVAYRLRAAEAAEAELAALRAVEVAARDDHGGNNHEPECQICCALAALASVRRGRA